MNKAFRLIIQFLCLFLLLPPLVLPQQVSLTILHTNDTHGHLLPFSYPSAAPPASILASPAARDDIGGIARRATLVKRLRRELESSGSAVWLVDTGDFSDGTPFSIEYHGKADIEAMNATGYNYATLGNHEFNNPLPRLKDLLTLFQYPILCANAIESSTGKPLVQTAEIRELGPLKIGIFGLITAETGGYPAAREGVKISPEIETARLMLRALRPKTDIIVVLSHAGEKMDEQISREAPGIDVIVGGHSHSRLPAGAFVWRSNDLKSNDVNGTIVVQAHQWGGELGRLDLLFSKNDEGTWGVKRYRARLIPVTADIPEDPAVAAVVERYWKPISARYGEVIGEASDDFVDRGDDLTPYHLVADSVRETLGVEFALENLGGVRAPLIKGKIKRSDLSNMDPFENKIVTFEITGRQLKEVLKKYRPEVSGIRYKLEHGHIVKATIGGKPIINACIYTGATNSYFSRIALNGIETKNTGKLRLEVLIDYIHRQGKVSPKFDGRRIIIEP